MLRLVLALLSSCKLDGPGLRLLLLSSLTVSMISLSVSKIMGLVPLLRTNLSCDMACGTLGAASTGLPALLTGVELELGLLFLFESYGSKRSGLDFLL